MINWKVRFQNRNWVIAFISQLFIVAQMILTGLHSLGVTDFQLTDAVKDWLLMFANAVFVLLSMLGLVQDPTTRGYRDSVRAMNYKKPN
ncbi:phage holin [Neobacillus mesonae]|uniref:Phage holin n=1 Tax=Neobacillus mesonae TaxID=1193713 RepID=A0A3Q9QU96_9BACI|nr:phage holin [Neobacillus mesonae]AZU61815.1 phage holin [Neobacillus mesonae]MED4205114.1 phage holin [Neobacillus mesonae]